MKASELDKVFEGGEDMSTHLDLSKARRPILEHRRVNIDFPTWMIDSLDRESKRLGVTRQSVVKMWIGERLEQTPGNKRPRK
jgi:hypothetical protein